MYIKKIKIENFKSIYEPLELDFTDIRGFWKISGSVGSGKTTIGEAIIYGLFGTVSGKNQADLISWGRKHGLIEVWCTSKARNIYIKRELNAYGQSPIYVEVDGEELVFTNKRDAQSQLEQDYYDTSKVTLELLCIISFNNFKSLATLNSMDTKKFLDQVLGFYTLTEYSEICKQLRNENYLKIQQINNTINRLTSQANKLEEISNMELINGDIITVKHDIDQLMLVYNQLNDEINTWVNNRKAEKNELDKKKATLIALGKNKAQEIKVIEKGICPTCGSKIDQSKLDVKKQEREILLEQYNDANEKSINIVNEIAEYQVVNSKKLSEAKNNVDQAKILLIKLEEQAKRLKLNYSEIDTIKQDIKKYEDELLIYKGEDNEWEQLYNILSTQIRSKILQSFIPALNKNILKYTQRLHLPYLVEFDSNFKCNISICGIDKDIPVSSLSTGQLKTVDMVIILGVLGTIIGNNGINILFLDELFSNLDANLRNEMCSVLRESLKPDSTIFIISHTDLEDRYFNGDIHMKIEVNDRYEKHSKINVKKIEGDR